MELRTEINHDLAIKEAERRWTDASERLKYANEYAQAALKGLFLANGAAIVALLTFIGNKEAHFGARGIWWAFFWFSLGLASVIATNVLGYISQASYMRASLNISWQASSDAHKLGHNFDHKKDEGRGEVAENTGIALSVLSLTNFLIGVFVA